jgi:hypothetical protein
MRWVPAINFFFFAFTVDGETVTPSAVDAMLGTIALVAALLFTIAAAAPTAVDFDELQEADDR